MPEQSRTEGNTEGMNSTVLQPSEWRLTPPAARWKARELRQIPCSPQQFHAKYADPVIWNSHNEAHTYSISKASYRGTLEIPRQHTKGLCPTTVFPNLN